MKLRFVVLLPLLVLLAATAAAQPVKVGVVNLARIEKESAAAQRATNALVAEFEPRNRQIEEVQKKIAAAQARFQKEEQTMSPSQRQAAGREVAEMMRQSDQALRALTEELELRRRDLAAKMLDDARAAIKIVAEAGKFDLILHEAAFARQGVDITDQVLKEMAKRGGGR